MAESHLAIIDKLLRIFKHDKIIKSNDKCVQQCNYLIIKQFLSPKDAHDFLELAMPLYPKHAQQGIVENNQEQGLIANDTKPSEYSSPVKWINIRGREKYMIHCEVLHLFLLCRGIYSRCNQYGRKFASAIVERKKYRSPYVFTNLYEKDRYHGVRLHNDDTDLFSMVIALTDDYGDGVLQIKDYDDNMCQIEMDKGDAVILAKDAYHKVPVMKREHDRIIIGLHC